MKKNNTLPGAALLIVLALLCGKTRAQVTDSTRTTGMEVKTFYSKILGEKRKIDIQTPAHMNAFDTYPVLYVLDGEAQTVMVGGQVQYLSDIYKIIPNLIVVGIENTDRMRDLTPSHSIVGPDGKPDTSSRAPGRNSGGGENFLQFIHSELMPYIESHYPASSYRLLTGHSLGALMAVYCLLHHPDYFNAYIAISPSLQWDNNALLREAATMPLAKGLNHTLLFFSDANEDSAFHQNQLALESLLQKQSSSGLRWKRLFYPGEIHTSEPVKAFYDGIRFVYPDWFLPYNSAAFKKSMRSSTILAHYEELSKLYGYKVLPPHGDMNQLARFMSRDPQRVTDAIELLQVNATNYPRSAAVQEIMGDIYLKQDNTQEAKAAYQKALVLDPDNEALKRKINH
jgi:predicted alpha/beta superfamily hydrolase